MKDRIEFIAKKLCPELIVKSLHFTRYTDLSRQVMDIFRRYDANMQPAGCDEGYMKCVYLVSLHKIEH